MMGTTFCRAISSSASCSWRQASHQVPHTLTMYTWPLNSELLTGRVESITSVSAIDGAGFPISGDGKAWISRFGLRPNANNTTSAMKAAKGKRNFHIMQLRTSCRSELRFRIGRGAHLVLHRSRRSGPIASVRGRQESADRHHQGAQPDIANQRLVLDAHAPRTIAQGISHGDEQVPRPVDGDRGLAVVRPLNPEVPLLRLQDRDRGTRAR